MSRASAFSLFLSFVFVRGLVFAQTQPNSDPLAVSLAQQSITALTGGAVVSDVTLNANVVSVVGPDSTTGTATLQAKGIGESRIDLSLPSGTSTDIRNDSAGYPQGTTAINGGTQQAWPLHNCWINASWFFPALSVLSSTSDPTVIFSYVGLETRNGTPVQHIQSYRYVVDPNRAATTALTQRLSTTDFYLDSLSLLPVSVTFNSHPYNDDGMDMTTEIDFSSYQPVNGVQVPFRIQKFVFGSLALDITVTGATVNSGISDSVFAIQ